MAADVMSAAEIKKLREDLGVTGDGLADLLDVAGGTVRRWECGMRPAKGPPVRLMRHLQAQVRRRRQEAARRRKVAAAAAATAAAARRRKAAAAARR